MGKWKHRTIEIDENTGIGTCSHCGANVKMRKRRNPTRWVCPNSDLRKSHASSSGIWKNSEWVKIREKLVAAQNGKCAICREETVLVLDHCHKTGNIRAALCNSCNIGLGMFKDNPKLLKRAALFLEENVNSNCEDGKTKDDTY